MMLKLRNLKITVFLKQPTTQKEISTKKIIEKLEISDYKITITIYKHTPNHIHITGIRNFRDVSKIRDILEKKFSKIINIRFDCMFITTRLEKSINIEKSVANLKMLRYYFTSYEPEIFSAIIVKPRELKKYPTMFLFKTGSIIILVGSKSLKRFVVFLNDILKNVTEIKKMNPECDEVTERYNNIE